MGGFDEDIEGHFARVRLRGQLLFGLTSVVVGAAALGGGLLLLYLIFFGARSMGRRPPIHLAFAACVVGIGFVVAGIRTLRKGEIDEATGHPIVGGKPVPPQQLLLAVVGISVATGLVAAWPLGVYRSVGTLSSACRSLLDADALAAIGGPPLVVESVSEDGVRCRLVGSAPPESKNRYALEVQVDGVLVGSQFDSTLRFIGGELAPLEGLGDHAVVGGHEGAWVIAFRRGHAGAIVKLSREVYGQPEVDRILPVLKERAGLLDSYAAEWIDRYGDR